MIPLPIDAVLPDIVRTLAEHNRLVLEAPPGAGKTTRVPPALLNHVRGEIWVLEPRRLAARMTARRVAQELGEPVGKRIGYQVRFEDVSSAETRVRFITEGLLARRMLSDPLLKNVGAVVLDEFHERHIHTDLALALVMRLQAVRPELRLLVMSATIESDAIAKHLGAPVLRSEGKRFEVSIEHLPRPDDRPLHQQVAHAVRQLAGEDGDILVFLPGAAEIRRAAEAMPKDLLVTMLYGDLPPEEQDRAVRPAERRKVILSTNVAETSLTIEGVTAVIDSGLARVASHAPWSGLPQLKLQRIAQAAAKQRAGRAGRLRSGRCVRLYTQHDYTTRPAFEQPELLRVDLSETLLLLHRLSALELPWLEAPPPQAMQAAELLLERLGAVAQGRLTSLGERMARFPAHPRVSRLLLEAEARGVAEEGATVAALLSERDLRRRDAGPLRSEAESDPIAALDEMRRAEGLSAGQLEGRGIDVGAYFAVKKQRDQLRRALGKHAPRLSGDRDTALGMAILAGFPDRVARRRQGKRHELVFATGGSGELMEQSVVKHSEWMVALDAEERDKRVRVRMASAISLDWVLELFMERVIDRTETTWNAQSERVDAMRRLRYEDFILEEMVDATPDPELVAETLYQAAKARGVRAFVEGEALDRFVGRVAFLRKACPELGLPEIDFDAVLREACLQTRSFAGLRAMDLLALAASKLDKRALDEHAPERLQLPGGRRAPIDYPLDQPPHISSRLQDFFGMRDGPKLAKGRVPLVIHLLAPNGRDVQVTTDLDGFWTRHYPAIAKELRRQYPRHAWPEDPRTAEPPKPKQR